ncbi:helix-turn-helix transcriptional regulator [Streptomyces pactum]|uniref:helix-turn-helix domain-containing protein n=1 Tax=Streptomyces pactum TaxID=68249 RepID=UPI0006E25A22|nr:helix-turn-helix transcriptional regulator [Streptomyces pactum]
MGRREAVAHSEAGRRCLPQTGRRRTPGLRREELALLAGISATWYSYLEQGREIRASEQVLNALAAALRLDRHERDHLLQLAGHVPAAQAEEREPLTAERHPRQGAVDYAYTAFHLAEQPEQTQVVYFDSGELPAGA